MPHQTAAAPAANLAQARPLAGRFYLLQCGWLLLFGALFYWLENATTLDQQLAQLFFDPQLRVFPLKDNISLELFNHRLLKYLLIAGGVWLALRSWRQRDARLGMGVLAMLLATVAVSWLKAHSAHSCPWDLVQFGGSANGYLLFGQVPLNPGPGRCFPGGHASAGFAVMGLFFYYWPSRRALAWWALAGGLGLGGLMGLGQMVRGAHFLSHNLWSGWVVWAVCVVLFSLYDLLLPRWHAARSKGVLASKPT